MSRARQAALRSLELDPTGAEAHATLGTSCAQFDWDTAGGERELKRALELGPGRSRRSPLLLALPLARGALRRGAGPERARAGARSDVRLRQPQQGDHPLLLAALRGVHRAVAEDAGARPLLRHGVRAGSASRYEQLGREREAVDAYIMPLTFGGGAPAGGRRRCARRPPGAACAGTGRPGSRSGREARGPQRHAALACFGWATASGRSPGSKRSASSGRPGFARSRSSRSGIRCERIRDSRRSCARRGSRAFLSRPGNSS